LTAGMNDYLWKPIVREELASILQKWLPAERLLTLPCGASSPASAEEEKKSEFWNKIKRVEGISVSLGLERFGGLHGVYKKTLRLIIQEINKSEKNLSAFLAADDMENFRVEVHGIKTALANIGAMELSGMAYDLEKASTQADSAFCTSSLPRLLAGLSELALQLKEVFGDKNHGDAPLSMPPELPPIFERLLIALNKMDMMAIEREVGNLDTSSFCGALEVAIEQIKDQVMIMDYDGAAGQIHNLLILLRRPTTRSQPLPDGDSQGGSLP